MFPLKTHDLMARVMPVQMLRTAWLQLILGIATQSVVLRGTSVLSAGGDSGRMAIFSTLNGEDANMVIEGSDAS